MAKTIDKAKAGKIKNRLIHDGIGFIQSASEEKVRSYLFLYWIVSTCIGFTGQGFRNQTSSIDSM